MLNLRKFTGGIAATNGWFLARDEGAGVLIDAPEGVATWLAESGLRVHTLLLTHLHFDHIMDAARVGREHGASLRSFTRPDPALTLEALFRGFAGTAFEIEPFAPEALLEGESRVLCGGDGRAAFDFEILHVPGHSPDSLCFHLREESVLLAGDTLFQGGIGRADFPGGNHALLVRGIREKILTLDPATRVLPGHGDETTVGEEAKTNPFL